jgi:hypothetical protein
MVINSSMPFPGNPGLGIHFFKTLSISSTGLLPYNPSCLEIMSSMISDVPA